MRNIKKFILLVFVILLTGCTNYDMSMKIDKDKSMLFSITILSDNQNEISNGIIILKRNMRNMVLLLVNIIKVMVMVL